MFLIDTNILVYFLKENETVNNNFKLFMKLSGYYILCLALERQNKLEINRLL